MNSDPQGEIYVLVICIVQFKVITITLKVMTKWAFLSLQNHCTVISPVKSNTKEVSLYCFDFFPLKF